MTRETIRLIEDCKKSKNAIAARLLLKLMQDLSEEYWGNEWICNNEYQLWQVNLSYFRSDHFNR
jgi:hypothetical protein